MAVPFGLIIKISEYFGLIQGVDTKVTKLLHQSFNSAKSNLEFALTASGQNQIDYIKQAKDEFIRAISVEENENKILALVGLSMCQCFLGDKINAENTMKRIKTIELNKSEKTKYMALEATLSLPLNIAAGYMMPFPSYEARIIHFITTKVLSLNFSRQLLQL